MRHLSGRCIRTPLAVYLARVGLVRLCAHVHCTGAHLRSTRSLKMDLERVNLWFAEPAHQINPNGLLLQPQIQMRFLEGKSPFHNPHL
jgi:hypothetical protein